MYFDYRTGLTWVDSRNGRIQTTTRVICLCCSVCDIFREIFHTRQLGNVLANFPFIFFIFSIQVSCEEDSSWRMNHNSSETDGYGYNYGYCDDYYLLDYGDDAADEDDAVMTLWSQPVARLCENLWMSAAKCDYTRLIVWLWSLRVDGWANWAPRCGQSAMSNVRLLWL